MIFDAILIILLYISFKKAGEKGCTDDLNFSIAFLISVRLAGKFYGTISAIVSNFIETSENMIVFGSYLVVLLFVLYLYNVIISKKIIEFGKKIPKKTGTLLTYIFAVFKTVIFYSVIFSFLYTIPWVQSFKEKYPTLIKPYTYQLTYGIIGSKSEEVLDRTRKLLTSFNLGFFEKQKRIHEAGSHKSLDAIKNNKDLQNFITEPEEKEE